MIIDRFGLTNCLISNDTELINNIDYSLVENKMNEFKENSISFLLNAIDN